MSGFSITAKESIQICFLVDATGSMGPYVDKHKTGLAKGFDIYVSMVAYRDRSDQNCMEKIGFTENLDEFQTFIRSLKYTGGDDECEDVQIGLKEVINLQWKQNALNLLIWIADSPCHGKQFHEDSVNDNYPQDDGEGLKKLLKQICDLDIDIYFYKITDTTNQMIKILKKYVFEFDKKLIQEVFKDSNFSKHVLKNYFNSQSDSAFGEFFKYYKKLDKKLQKAMQIKTSIKEYQQKIDIQWDHFKFRDSFASQCLQESDISNTDEIEYNDDIKQNYWLRSIQGDIFSFR
ncbi:hypothetical protein ABPG73_011933 [Tetrahymena malaccensis]